MQPRRNNSDLGNLVVGPSPLHKAVFEGNADEVSKLLLTTDPTEIVREGVKDHVKVFFEQSNTITPLHHATSTGDVAILKMLLKVLPDTESALRVKDFQGWTPIHLAVIPPNLGILQLFLKTLDNSAAAVNCLNEANNDGISPFMKAVQRDCVDVVRVMLDAVSSKDSMLLSMGQEGLSPVRCAIENENTELLRLLLNKISVAAEPSVYQSLLADYLSSAFHLDSNESVTRILLTSIPSQSLVTCIKPAMFDAIRFDRASQLELLLSWVTDDVRSNLLSLTDTNQNTPLHLAAKKDKIKVLRLLLRFLESAEKEACLKCKNRSGKTPITVAAPVARSILQVEMTQLNTTDTRPMADRVMELYDQMDLNQLKSSLLHLSTDTEVEEKKLEKLMKKFSVNKLSSCARTCIYSAVKHDNVNFLRTFLACLPKDSVTRLLTTKDAHTKSIYEPSMSKQMVSLLQPYCDAYILPQSLSAKCKTMALVAYNTIDREEGSEVEAIEILTAFQCLGTATHVLKNWTNSELSDKLCSMRREVEESCLCLFVVVMCHGYNGVVIDRNQQPCEINDITCEVNAIARDIPKVRTLPACIRIHCVNQPGTYYKSPNAAFSALKLKSLAWMRLKPRM